ncbi:MAG: 50S ribosomal protein L13 [Candidatus Magasanikbacteria bacterium RIFCSPHIGHO2_02_FULL_47_14]|uniref:Large ribosomal subunit protein uL13 n=1 Tax=Candidatus Magasanikbacteria bacterium RIFCSPHIGHO2_02_FULL_47_14 TaxID=1798680 RepID=A0A1F6M7E6_9BACT|nr:MAG: 50S ribosomal protein L13 [Candidatus Magasanikbacteria bacterium RIFCSPHIGHO2_02_FULL_47_14]
MKAITRETMTIDATGKAPGRVATQIALYLRGKHKPDFQPHIDAGDLVHVVNAAKIEFTGRKLVQKDYRHHTMHPGGLKRTPAKAVFESDPAKVIRHAVYGMLPKNKHRDEMMKRLKIDA